MTATEVLILDLANSVFENSVPTLTVFAQMLEHLNTSWPAMQIFIIHTLLDT